MKTLSVFMILALMLTASCSNRHKKNNDQTAEQTTVSEEDADFIVDADDEELIFEDTPIDDSNVVEEIAESEPVVEDISMEIAENTSSTEVGSDWDEYMLEKNETLMMVAFKIYGDYRMWKELAQWNPGLLNSMNEGSMVKFKKPTQEFVWSPSGLPHLISRGETLGTISQDKYKTTRRWKEIYENNQPLIRDPNLIFAGFTIYYVPDRDIASE